MTHRVLSSQFLSHADLGNVRAGEWPGTIGEPDPVGRMQGWQDKFGGTGEARPYSDGDGPAGKVDALREHLRGGGEVPPIHINHWKASGYMSISDGHHRAVAAHLEGKGIHADIHEWDNI